MLLSLAVEQTVDVLLSYLISYNSAYLVLFSISLQISGKLLKDLKNVFGLGISNIWMKLMLITLVSMAGIPPFMGFIWKVALLALVAGTKLSALFSFYFLIMFTGLYFYVQNIRILNASSKSLASTTVDKSSRTPLLILHLSLVLAVFFLFGGNFSTDISVYSSWTLS